jgi:ketosteroid isomerase-like protein
MSFSQCYELVVAMNDCISRHDLQAMEALLAEDHRFIDSENRVVSGRPAVVDAWRRFFTAYPDYRNAFEQFVFCGDAVAIRGRGHCEVAALDGPALWRARIRDGLVVEWQVYRDSPANRTLLGFPA